MDGGTTRPARAPRSHPPRRRRHERAPRPHTARGGDSHDAVSLVAERAPETRGGGGQGRGPIDDGRGGGRRPERPNDDARPLLIVLGILAIGAGVMSARLLTNGRPRATGLRSFSRSVR